MWVITGCNCGYGDLVMNIEELVNKQIFDHLVSDGCSKSAAAQRGKKRC